MTFDETIDSAAKNVYELSYELQPSRDNAAQLPTIRIPCPDGAEVGDIVRARVRLSSGEFALAVEGHVLEVNTDGTARVTAFMLSYPLHEPV